MVIEFTVEGSKGDEYTVKFTREGDIVTASCTCPAGRFGNFCKHRYNIIRGIDDAVVSENYDDLDLVQEWCQDSQLLDGILEMSKARKAVEEAEKNLKACRKRFAALMKGKKSS